MGIFNKIIFFFFVTLRIWKYQLLSDCKRISGKPNMFHPILLKGKGKISFDKNVQIGVVASPNFYSHYAYLEVRNSDSEITIGNNVSINNAFSAVAFSKITIHHEYCNLTSLVKVVSYKYEYTSIVCARNY